MNNANIKNFLGKAAIFVVAGALVVGQFAVFFRNNVVVALAEESRSEIIYYADTIYGEDTVFEGEGSVVTSTYTIDCDEMITVSSSMHSSVPSFGNDDPTMQNVCGPTAGTNIVAFYDRWYTNLIPNYTAGMEINGGQYLYYPNMGLTNTRNVIESLYDLMNVETVGGTTSRNFRNGLTSYVEDKGYNLSFSSMYQNQTMVNLNMIATAVNQNKVGLVMCSEYNFVYTIQSRNDGSVHVSKESSTMSHIMMVFGYQTLAFYKNGNHVCTKTFLRVCSGFGSCDIGYMELNDFSVIDEAYIASVT